MNHPYQLLGVSVPKLLGRTRLLLQLDRHLRKPSPDHVSVVGPALYGKSVLLAHVAGAYRAAAAPYVTSAFTDLRHSPPLTDTEFLRRMVRIVEEALRPGRPELAGYLDTEDESPHELLDLVFHELEQHDEKMLVVLDGFDHVLAGTGLTRRLWDQLRSLAQKPSLSLVTGSRKPLRELCHSEESRTSDFWEVFYDTPLQVGPFEEADWDDLLAPLIGAGVTVEPAARKELANWTGGVPVLAVALLRGLAEALREGERCDKGRMEDTARELLDQGRHLLEALWDECGGELRADLAAVAAEESDGVPVSHVADGRRRVLEARGFARLAGGRLRPACRLMARYARQQGPAIADLNRLFARAEDYEGRVRGLLELRLKQVSSHRIPPELRQYVENAVEDLEPNPELALKWLRSIASRALRLVWEAELDKELRIPAAWLEVWQQAGERLAWLEPGNRLPRREGLQCAALRLAAGNERCRPVTRFASKPTVLLLDALQSVGDFGQHREEYPESGVTRGFAAAMVLTAIELMDSLARDLARKA